MTRQIVLALTLGSAAFGYIRLNTYETTIVPLQRVDNTAIQFYLNNLIVPGAQSSASGKAVTVITADSDPMGAATSAIATWNALTTANVHFMPILSTTAGHNSSDYQMVISIASSAADVSAVGSGIAITVNSWAAGPASLVNGQLLQCTTSCTYQDGSILDSDILLSPSVNFSTTGATGADLQGVLTHEFGHSLGADHTGILGATMFQYSSINNRALVNQRLLSADDLAFVTSAYPATSGTSPLGTISGKITLAGTGLPYALLTFIDSKQGNTLGGLSNPDGTYSLQVPPGSYIMYAEPFTIVQPGNLYFTAAEAALAQGFQPTFLGGASNPTTMSVTANNTTTANLAVSAGSTLSIPGITFGGAGKSGDVAVPSIAGGPIPVSSGQSVDLVFQGSGFDQTTTVAVFGEGITAGPVRVDSTNSILLRSTLTIPAVQNPGLATVVFTKGNTSLTLSGIIFVGPLQASFTAANVLNGGSFLSPGQVSPGEIVSVFGSNLGPPSAINYLTPGIPVFSSASILTKDMANTRVLFDGVPAPILATSSGQVNAVVPYEVAGKTSTQVQVEYQGLASPAVPIAVVATAPGMLQLSAGEALAQNNVDFSLNTASSPVARGNYIDIYGTGEGQTNPAGIDGLGQAAFNGTNRQPVAGVSATVAGQPAPSAAVFTNSVSGLAQIVVQIPTNISAGAATVVVTIGGVASPPATIYVK